MILLLSWRTHDDAEEFEVDEPLPIGGRLRRVRIVRDYGMFDRREDAAILSGGGTAVTNPSTSSSDGIWPDANHLTHR